jgi:hypothetical protein
MKFDYSSCQTDNGHVHSAYNLSFSAYFFSRNSIFLSQQISQQCFSAGLSAQPNGSNITSYKKEIYIICVKVMCDNGLLTLAAGFSAAMPRNLLSLHAIQGIIMVQFPPPL